jgi:hypothetical protein
VLFWSTAKDNFGVPVDLLRGFIGSEFAESRCYREGDVACGLTKNRCRRRPGAAHPARDVPPQLKDVSLRTLDVGLISAGASMRREFENMKRLRRLELKCRAKATVASADDSLDRI